MLIKTVYFTWALYDTDYKKYICYSNRKHLAMCLNNETSKPTILYTLIPLILVYRLVYLLYGCFSEKRNHN